MQSTPALTCFSGPNDAFVLSFVGGAPAALSFLVGCAPGTAYAELIMANSAAAMVMAEIAQEAPAIIVDLIRHFISPIWINCSLLTNVIRD
jgi:hypothetical protein